MLLTEKIGQKNLIDRTNRKTKQPSNIFGLGLVSLIAACSSAEEGAGAAVRGSSSTEINDGNNQQLGFTGGGVSLGNNKNSNFSLPFQALQSEAAGMKSGYTAHVERDDSDSDKSQVRLQKVPGPTNPGYMDVIISLADKDAGYESNNFDRSYLHQLTTASNSRYDLVITMGDTKSSNRNSPEYHKGEIYIYWNVASIRDEGSPHLTFKGATKNDGIGTILRPEFLQLGGEMDKYDMVIVGREVQKNGDPDKPYGALYVLWDIDKYYNQTDTIDLSDEGLRNGADAGSLAIYGGDKTYLPSYQDNRAYKQYYGAHIGDQGTAFAQLGGKDDNHDLIIFDNYNHEHDAGIYVLWDIADYYKEGSHVTIDLDDSDDYSSGMFVIDGAAADFLFFIDDFGKKKLLDIDGDADGTYDLVVLANGNAYILFGDKIASDGNNDGKVDSKSINLVNVDISLDDEAGFFSYNFEHHTSIRTTATANNKVGYRLAPGEAYYDGSSSYTRVKDAHDQAVAANLSAEELNHYWDIL